MSNDGYASFLEHLTDRHLELPSYEPEHFLYGHNGPCPQVARDHPFGQVPEILDIPQKEQDDWDRYVRNYYRTEAFMLELNEARRWRRRRWAESGGHGYANVTDDTFLALMTEGLYSKFLCNTLDEIDRKRFGGLLEAKKDYWKSDYSCMEAIRRTRDPEAFHAATVVLLEKSDAGFQVVAIDLRYQDDNDTFQYVDAPLVPDGSAAWRLAKYFVLQGAIHRINLIDHGKVHFPGDVINAITKTALPMRHLVHQLLMPHFWLTLPVNYAVLEGEKSLISRNGTYPYSPFVAEKREVRRLLALGWYGWKYYFRTENSAYPPYTFKTGSPKIPSVYGWYMEKCYETIEKFVREILELLPANDSHVDWIEIQGWAAQISSWLPGFPEWEEFAFGSDAEKRKTVLGRLTAVLTTIIHNASVVHSCDHASLHHMINSFPVPFILRVKPPRSQEDTIDLPDSLKNGFEALFDFVKTTVKDFVTPDAPTSPWLDNDSALLCHPEDLESTCWADLLFYRAHNSTLLIDCNYQFEDPRAHDAVSRFRDALEDLSRRTATTVAKHKLPWVNPVDSGEDSDKFRERHCVGAGIQY